MQTLTRCSRVQDGGLIYFFNGVWQKSFVFGNNAQMRRSITFLHGAVAHMTYLANKNELRHSSMCDIVMQLEEHK